MNKDEREKEQKLTMPCGDADIPEEARKDCYAGWTQWRDENEAVGDCADLCDYRAGFITGWQARAAWDGGEICGTEGNEAFGCGDADNVRKRGVMPANCPLCDSYPCDPGCPNQKGYRGHKTFCPETQPADEVCECGHDKDRHHDDAEAWCGYWNDGCPCRNFRPAPQPDEYLAEKIARATKTWQGIDPDSVSDVQPPREDGVK